MNGRPSSGCRDGVDEGTWAATDAAHASHPTKAATGLIVGTQAEDSTADYLTKLASKARRLRLLIGGPGSHFIDIVDLHGRRDDATSPHGLAQGAYRMCSP